MSLQVVCGVHVGRLLGCSDVKRYGLPLCIVIADYVHTVILFVAIFTFGFTMYSTSELVGRYDTPDFLQYVSLAVMRLMIDDSRSSPSKLYDLLLKASVNMPITDNFEGSYLTFKSINGLVFAIDLLVAGTSFQLMRHAQC